MSENIVKYNQESAKAISVLSEQNGIEISDLEFQVALGSKLGYSRTKSHYILSHELSAEQMIELIQNFSFERPEILAETTFEESIIPEGIPAPLNEQKLKSKGEIWYIHKYDADPFPSNPHAHNSETGYKVHLGTGELFDAQNNPLKQSIRKKDLIALRALVTKTALPVLAV